MRPPARQWLPAAFAALVLLLSACSSTADPTGSAQPTIAETIPADTATPAASSATPDSSSPAQSAEPTDAHRLAFVREGEIVLLDVDTGDEEILPAPDRTVPLAWAVDGSFLMVAVFDADNLGSTLFRVPVDGGNPVELMRVFPGYGPIAFSRDGRGLAIGSDGAAPNGLVTVDLESGEATQLTEDGGTTPLWSPDGRSIAYEASTGGGTNLIVVDVDTGETRQITDDDSFDLPKAWTEDGAAVLIFSDRNTDMRKGSARMWQADVATGALIPRPDLRGDGPNVLRSPNGEWDALMYRDGTLAIAPAGVAPGDAQPEPITRVEGGLHVTWSPEGDRLVSTQGEGASLALVLIEAPDGEPILLTETGGRESNPVWGPAHHGP